MEKQFKIGDIVITKPGFTRECNGGKSPTEGGRGYKENFKFKIDHITTSHYDKKIAWSDDGGNGIYFQALEIFNSEPNYEIY